QIGSVKGPKNFGSNQTVFHRDDIPAERRERKKEVNQWKENKILLGGKPPGWRSSVSLSTSRLVGVRTKANSDLDPGKPYQYNYRAEVLPPKSPPPVPKAEKFKVSTVGLKEAKRRLASRAQYPDDTINHPKLVAEMPINPRLKEKPPWRPSTQPDPKERKACLLAEEESCKRAARIRNGLIRAYTAPEQQEKARREMIREVKRKGELRTLKELEPEPLPSTHNRLAKDPIRRVRRHRHSGTWEYSEREGCHMWSDTASFNRDSPGDLVRVHNPQGFNFSSPCLIRQPAPSPSS
ncbi:unnamed protein product, partial [Discosporangium mesarthrocarpum]